MQTDDLYILCHGCDEILLGTRQALLSTLGCSVFSTLDQADVRERLLRGEVSLLVLCHSVGGEGIKEISKFHQGIECPAPILCLTIGERSPAAECSWIYDTLNGPAAFIAEVSKIRGSSDVKSLSN